MKGCSNLKLMLTMKWFGSCINYKYIHIEQCLLQMSFSGIYVVFMPCFNYMFTLSSLLFV
uniref:Uncharacterized protein n=1 Tax=Lepeophtheirus salmonis TaxID=72036 RepID=A0A0K2VI49_LEPSM